MYREFDEAILFRVNDHFSAQPCHDRFQMRQGLRGSRLFVHSMSLHGVRSTSVWLAQSLRELTFRIGNTEARSDVGCFKIIH